MHFQKRGLKGFTLIELLISITILAILVAMAVPAYKNYSVRSKVTECINNSAVAKVQISEYKQSMGPWPPNPIDAGLDNAGISNFCNGFINYSSLYGSFEIDINESAVDSSIVGQIAPVMTPSPTPENIINWTCSHGSTSPDNVKYLPSTCRGS